MVSLHLFTFLTFFIKLTLASFPIHDPNEDVIINPVLDPRDKPACGMFNTNQGRVYNGIKSYVGQFPWTVCIVDPQGTYVINFENEPPLPVNNLRDMKGMTIWNIGRYPFSRKKGSVTLQQVKSYGRLCTGSIIDDHFLVTAAHCMTRYWEGNYFIVTAGSIKCINDPNAIVKQVIVSRLDPFKTVFEHPEWIRGRGGNGDDVDGYDIAIVRIQEPYTLPVDNYNNEKINRICIYSYQQLPVRGCLKNVYFSGFGLKKDYRVNHPSKSDPDGELTWLRMARVSDTFCNQHSDLVDVQDQEVYCYTSVLEHSNMNSSSITSAGLTDESKVKLIPNVCPGDSGGPFMYYMKFDKPEVAGYRALLLSPAQGTTTRKPYEGICENEYFKEKDSSRSFLFITKYFYYKPLAFASILYTKIDTMFWNESINYQHKGQVGVSESFVKYPRIS